MSVRDSPVLSSKIDAPLTKDDKRWESKMAALVADCLEVGLIRQIRRTLDSGSVSIYGMQALNHVACDRRQRTDCQRSEFDRQLLHMSVDKDTLNVTVRKTQDRLRKLQDRLRKLQELQSLRDVIVCREQFVGLIND